MSQERDRAAHLPLASIVATADDAIISEDFAATVTGRDGRTVDLSDHPA
jgi:hypothetical protein